VSSAARNAYQLAFEISPIVLVEGIASNIPGGLMPIVFLTEAANFTDSLLNGNVPDNLDRYFAHWKPLPGTTLIQNAIATYPFANQAVAANAVIRQPLTISMLMNCPVQQAGGYAAKLATVTVLQGALQQHINAGGTFTIATPACMLPNCILLNMRDVSGGESKQPQHTFQFDFIQPLITLNTAAQVYNNLMSRINAGLPTGQTPTWSGVQSSPASAANPVPLTQQIGYPFSVL
jgi:hypothetical protein